MCYMSNTFNFDNELVFVLLAKTKRNKIILKFKICNSFIEVKIF